MRTIRVDADPHGIAAAIAALRAGRCVALPTETVYGLAADATDADAVARIFAAKGRPAHNPLIVHVLDIAQAHTLATWTPLAERLAAAHWPGPLTLVLRSLPGDALAPQVRAGLSTVALRSPRHPAFRAVLAGLGRPLAAPSANRSGRLSPTSAEHVLASLDGRIPLVLDGGPATVGLESTIVDASGIEPRILRPGTLSAEQLEAERSAVGTPDRPTAPGQLLRHYAPRTPLRLDARTCAPDEAWLGFGPGEPPPCVASDNLSATGDLEAAAQKLYAALHALDAAGARCIAVAPIPDRGIGGALNDRLRRAAEASAAREP